MAFFYVYKSLAHPEKDGYVQPVSLEERLTHIARAREEYGTSIPWLADSMSNDLKHAFGDRNNSEFVISPEGKVLIARTWSSPGQLRKDLERLVGKADTTSDPSDFTKPTSVTDDPTKEIARGVVPRVPRPSGAEALTVIAHPNEKENPLYLKLRAEAPSSLSRQGKGPLHIGFHLDPIHRVHWNNLAAPLTFEITAPGGITLTPSSGEAAKVTESVADADPREFLVEVDRGSSGEPIEVTVNYFACDDDDQWCKAVTQRFTIEWTVDRDAGRVQNHGGGSQRPGPGMNRRPVGNMPDPSRILSRFDTNEDGNISKEEATGPMARRFDQMDADDNGVVTKEELTAAFEARKGG